MASSRYLGSGWATVHGPADPRRLWLWLLDAKFAGLLASPGPRAVDWTALHAAAEGLPVGVAAIRAGSALQEKSATAGLASARDSEQRAAASAIETAVLAARTLGCPLVVVEPGVVPLFGDVEHEDLVDPALARSHDAVQALLARRKAALNGALDRVCRALFAAARAHPDVRFCLTAGRSLRTVGDRVGLLAVLEDLAQLRLLYWHDAAVVARRAQLLGEAQGEWLETFASRCGGYVSGDATPDGLYLPPGSGGVDYGLLASYVRRSNRQLPNVVELDPAVAPSELPGVRDCLDKYGL